VNSDRDDDKARFYAEVSGRLYFMRLTKSLALWFIGVLALASYPAIAQVQKEAVARSITVYKTPT
jgi:hypothetical protein